MKKATLTLPPVYFLLFIFSLLTFSTSTAKADPPCEASTYACGNVCCPRDQDCKLSADGSGMGECKNAPMTCGAAGQVVCYNKATHMGACCDASTIASCVEGGCAFPPTEPGPSNEGSGGVPSQQPSGSSGGTVYQPLGSSPHLQVQKSPFTTVPPVCGDGKVQVGEQCDDNNNTNGDGCSAKCTVESCYTCSGSPSVCRPRVPCFMVVPPAGIHENPPTFSLCGNHICNAGENNNNCPADCTPVCGNNVCELGEDNKNCAQDCPVK